jgi:hypothetical protein
MNNQFGDHEGMIATNPSVLQGLDAGAYWGAKAWRQLTAARGVNRPLAE